MRLTDGIYLINRDIGTRRLVKVLDQGDGELRVLGPSPSVISLFPGKVLPVIGIAQVQAIPIAPAISRMGNGQRPSPRKKRLTALGTGGNV
jgi:hypothetical protein